MKYRKGQRVKIDATMNIAGHGGKGTIIEVISNTAYPYYVALDKSGRFTYAENWIKPLYGVDEVIISGGEALR